MPRLLLTTLLAASTSLGTVSPCTAGASTSPVGSAAETGRNSKYLEDYEFVVSTVASQGAAVKWRKIDWKAEAAKHRKRFADCDNDLDHLKNVMRLLAILKDGHTGVTRTSIEGKRPSKFDHLYGAGMWLVWEQGRVHVRGLMEGHSLEGQVPPGSMLVSVDKEPAWLALGRAQARIEHWMGTSSPESMWGTLGNKLLPMGDRQSVQAVFRTPAGKTKQVTAPRWGPGGKSYSMRDATMPDGVEWKKGATSAFLDLPWGDKVGYLRITGSMDQATVSAFHKAFDALQGMEALLLDCRSMGGGGDGFAWEMAGRFYPDGVNNGRHGRIEASGSWQFDGPVVMLQDELEVSSAETFTWAMSETGRVVSVGRATGGWGIIPKGFDCPSGLLSFRLGVNHRPTPIKGVYTEGTGWPADVKIPYGPVFCERPDRVREVGLEALSLMHAGIARDTVRDAFQELFAGHVAKFKKREGAFQKKLEGWSPDPLAKDVLRDIELTITMERFLINDKDAIVPDAIGLTRRLPELKARAKAAGVKSISSLEKAVKSLKKETAAQETLADAVGEDDKARAAWFKRHGKTRTGQLLKQRSRS